MRWTRSARESHPPNSRRTLLPVRGRRDFARAYADPHRLAHRCEPVRLQPGGKVAGDAADQARAVIDQRRIELHRAGAGADLGVGVRAAGDPAGADQDDAAGGGLMEPAQDSGRKVHQRRARQAAGLAPVSRFQAVRPRDRGVAGDDGVHAVGDGRLGDGLDLLVAKVRRHLQEYRLVAALGLRQRRAGLGQPAEQLLQRLARLQRAQARRIGRGDVDGEIVRPPPQPLQAQHIVAHPVGGVLVGPDIGPDNPASGPRVEPPGEGLQALVVEAHPVDHRAVFAETEQARARITGLGQGRDRAAFDETQPGPQHGVRDLGVLVEPRRQADAAGQGQAAQARGQDRFGVVALARAQPGPQQRHGQLVRGLRIDGPQRLGGQIVNQAQRRASQAVERRRRPAPATRASITAATASEP